MAGPIQILPVKLCPAGNVVLTWTMYSPLATASGATSTCWKVVALLVDDAIGLPLGNEGGSGQFAASHKYKSNSAAGTGHSIRTNRCWPGLAAAQPVGSDT